MTAAGFHQNTVSAVRPLQFQEKGKLWLTCSAKSSGKAHRKQRVAWLPRCDRTHLFSSMVRSAVLPGMCAGRCTLDVGRRGREGREGR